MWVILLSLARYPGEILDDRLARGFGWGREIRDTNISNQSDTHGLFFPVFCTSISSRIPYHKAPFANINESTLFHLAVIAKSVETMWLFSLDIRHFVSSFDFFLVYPSCLYINIEQNTRPSNSVILQLPFLAQWQHGLTLLRCRRVT